MKPRSTVLAATLLSLFVAGVHAQNTSYYFDLNGPQPGSGVSSGSTYVWDTSNVVWNNIPDGGDGVGTGIFTNWQDNAANNTAWRAQFSAGGPEESYTVVVPEGQRRTFQFFFANRDKVTLTSEGSGDTRGHVRPFNTAFNAGFQAVNPGTLTLSNVHLVETNANFFKIQGGNFAGLVKLESDVRVGFKQWSIENYGTFDLGAMLDNNQIFTANYPYGGRIAHVFFNNSGGLAVLQGSGNLTLPITFWFNAGADPAGGLSWNDPNAQYNLKYQTSGGFAGRGGKLTVNLYGDGRTLQWTNPVASQTPYFVGKLGILVLGSYYADSEVEFQNGIDLTGDKWEALGDEGSNYLQKVLVPAAIFAGPAGAGSFATISGNISDSVGGGGIIKLALTDGKGSGTLVLSGANTYSGPTVVAQGKLVVTSAHQGGGAFVATNGATVGVRVTGSVPVPMASLALGSATGGNGKLEIDYEAASSQPALRSTNFVVEGTTTLVTVKGTLALGQIPLIKYNGAIGGNGFAGLSLDTLPPGVTASLVDNSANNSVDLNVTALPGAADVNITHIAVNGGSVVLDFTAGASDTAGDFTLQRSATVDTGYGDDPGAVITGTAPNFQATTTAGGAAQFYRVRR
jgi:autotransporter-associated beta strand protein